MTVPMVQAGDVLLVGVVPGVEHGETHKQIQEWLDSLGPGFAGVKVTVVSGATAFGILRPAAKPRPPVDMDAWRGGRLAESNADALEGAWAMGGGIPDHL